ncbi:kinase-like protein [Gigaspora margarita]|uniref:Kinase-like protein n=1 Tax=Gigaspora margarita TaxID=4874 RepID=A0A8H4AWN8_GIGMA|nr:kinase-like protein [Gigaspora margarita]
MELSAPVCDIKFSDLEIDFENSLKGGFGEVYKGKLRGHIIAAKYVKRETPTNLKDFNRELKALRLSEKCKSNIIKFFGLSYDPKRKEYILVMQFANNGTLKNYLRKHKDTLKLSNKIYICISIIEGLKFLHDNKIVNGDLHSNNVLIHDDKALLADFGLSKSLLEPATISVVRVQAYVDPILLSGRLNYTDKYEKYSDIYSFGVLMWETYTCRSPLEGKLSSDLTHKLCLGLREKREKGMPMQYIDIYEKCWSPDPSLRPEISEILYRLNNLSGEPIYTDIDIPSSEISYPNREILSNTVVQQDDLTSEMQLYNSSELTLSDSFLTLIEKACQIENFYSSYNNMQLNQRMCKQLGRYIIKSVSEVKLLQNQDNYDEFLTLENYNSFCKFLKNLEEIKNFIVDISQIRKLIFFIQETDCGISLERLKDKYVKLLEKFHESASSLQFNIPVDDKIDDVHKDIDETIEFIQTYRRNFGSGSLFQLIEKTSKDIQNAANNKLFEDVNIQEPYDNQNVITKVFEPDDKKLFWIRVAVLKNLKDFANVAKFYGAINLGNQVRITIEKSEETLMTYYKSRKLDISIKLKFALEICGALVFLNAVDFLHRAIKSEYILITNDLKAKITYFCKSRLVSDKSGVLPINTGYVAPEIFIRNKRTFIDAQACVENLDEKYNFTCEVYCFGILLWELAHEEDPYQYGLEKIYNDSYLLKNYDKNLVPKEYADINIKALSHNPKIRPTICDIYKKLHLLNCQFNPNYIDYNQI